jgi:hypothetical protein
VACAKGTARSTTDAPVGIDDRMRARLLTALRLLFVLVEAMRAVRFGGAPSTNLSRKNARLYVAIEGRENFCPPSRQPRTALKTRWRDSATTCNGPRVSRQRTLNEHTV